MCDTWENVRKNWNILSMKEKVEMVKKFNKELITVYFTKENLPM